MSIGLARLRDFIDEYAAQVKVRLPLADYTGGRTKLDVAELEALGRALLTLAELETKYHGIAPAIAKLEQDMLLGIRHSDPQPL